jgi:hypothetical protein
LLSVPLRDIHGIDAVPWWPPAPGWWLLAGGCVLLIFLGVRWWHGGARMASALAAVARWLLRPAWQRAAARELKALRQSARELPVRELADGCSALLRRIAMARHGRTACAGLHGQAWLDWLSAHDPAGFDWSRQARWLVRAPFAPPQAADASPSRVEIERLLGAIARWIDAAGQPKIAAGNAAIPEKPPATPPATPPETPPVTP